MASAGKTAGAAFAAATGAVLAAGAAFATTAGAGSGIGRLATGAPATSPGGVMGIGSFAVHAANARAAASNHGRSLIVAAAVACARALRRPVTSRGTIVGLVVSMAQRAGGVEYLARDRLRLRGDPVDVIFERRTVAVPLRR
jgi:hypothetical protein